MKSIKNTANLPSNYMRSYDPILKQYYYINPANNSINFDHPGEVQIQRHSSSSSGSFSRFKKSNESNSCTIKSAVSCHGLQKNSNEGIYEINDNIGDLTVNIEGSDNGNGKKWKKKFNIFKKKRGDQEIASTTRDDGIYNSNGYNFYGTEEILGVTDISIPTDETQKLNDIEKDMDRDELRKFFLQEIKEYQSQL